MNELKSAVMKRAWDIAGYGARRFGGNKRDYFAEAMKLAWAQRDQLKGSDFWPKAKPKKNVIQLKDWFLSKNYALKSDLAVAEKTQIAKESEKALLVEVIVNNQIISTYWVPKSVVA